jgi:fructokinase
VQLAEAYDIDIVLVTCGSRGALVFDRAAGQGDERFALSRAADVRIADTVGAGDSFSAGFLFALLSGRTAFQAADLAAAVADYVVSQTGAVPDYPRGLQRRLEAVRCSAHR